MVLVTGGWSREPVVRDAAVRGSCRQQPGCGVGLRVGKSVTGEEGTSNQQDCPGGEVWKQEEEAH